MPAYLIARVRVQEPTAYEEYKRLAAAAIAKFGGATARAEEPR